MKDQFQIRDTITFLNFGSFGACPLPVFEVYQNFQRELEQEPVEFMVEKAPRYLKKSRQALGQYLNCHEDELVCVTNPSYAVNIVAKNLELKPGDEILTTDLEYGPCNYTWDYYCKKSGAKYIRQKTIFPIEDKQTFIENFTKAITPKTKLLFMSHITSTTALRLPVEEICALAREKGIMTFVDGAHAPAQVTVDLQQINADIYTGACHKWMMAPKGSSFLYVRKELQHLFDPLVISWGFQSEKNSGSQFIDYHETQGTRDLSAFCSIPASIEFMHENNWEQVSRDCRKTVQQNAPELCGILGRKPLSAINDDFVAQMYSCEINTDDPVKLHDLLFHRYKIEIPIMAWKDTFFIRYSFQAFNSQRDLDRLFTVLKEIS